MEGAIGHKRRKEKRGEGRSSYVRSGGQNIQKYKARGCQLEQESFLWDEGNLQDVPVAQLDMDDSSIGRLHNDDLELGYGGWPQSAARAP